MILNAITYIIILGAILAFGRNILLFFNFVKTTKSSKCAGCSGSCDVKAIKFPSKEELHSYDKYRIRL